MPPGGALPLRVLRLLDHLPLRGGTRLPAQPLQVHALDGVHVIHAGVVNAFVDVVVLAVVINAVVVVVLAGVVNVVVDVVVLAVVISAVADVVVVVLAVDVAAVLLLNSSHFPSTSQDVRAGWETPFNMLVFPPPSPLKRPCHAPRPD